MDKVLELQKDLCEPFHVCSSAAGKHAWRAAEIDVKRFDDTEQTMQECTSG